MIIDLSVPRVFIKDKIDEVIFDLKMKGINISRHQICAIITAAIILGCNRHALAYDGVIEVDDCLKKDIYSVIFAAIETLKSCTINEFKNMASYLSNTLR